MKYILLILFSARVAFGDAVIFSGNDVKTLKQNIDLFGVAKILSGSVDPSAGAGVIAPIGSIYLSTGFGLYSKTGAGNTAWTKNQLSPVNLATDVTGIIPAANGGTGLDGSTATNGSLLIGNGSGYTLFTLTGTANQVNITNGAGSITLSTPQDIATTSSPTFANETITGDITLSNAAYDNTQVGKSLAQEVSTGLLSDGLLSIDADPAKFDLGAGTGQITDYATDPTNPTINKISWSAFDAQTLTNLATADKTYILINGSGAIVQQTTFPTQTERRQMIFIGTIIHPNRTTIQNARTIPDFIQSNASQTYDFWDALGAFNISGNRVSANGANLSFDRTAGSVFRRGANYQTSDQNPHVATTASGAPQSFVKSTQTVQVGGSVTVIDPANYDVAGTVTAVGGGANTSTIQRVYIFSSGLVFVTYGQTTYASLTDAVAGISSENFNLNPNIADGGILLAYIVVTRTCTALNNPTCAVILPAARFDAGAGGGSTSVTNLQQAYNNSTQPQIILDSTHLGVQIADNSTPLGSDLFEVMNSGGTTEYLKVSALGVSTTNFTGTGTAGAVRVHNLTTTQRDALTPASGMQIYNTTNARMECYTTAWIPCGGGRSVSSQVTLSDGGTITISASATDESILVAGTSGHVVLDAVPFGTTTPVNGYRLTLIGNDNDATIQIPGFMDSGVAKNVIGATLTLGFGQTATYEYNSTLDAYVLISSSN